MKRGRKAEFASRSADSVGAEARPRDPKTLSEEEKIERLREALKEGRENAARERYEDAWAKAKATLKENLDNDEETARLFEMVQEAMPPVLKYSGHITGFTKTENGGLLADVQWFSKASDEVVALMEQIHNEDVHLFTGLHWTNLPVQDRLETLERMGMSAELAVASSVLEVLPEGSRDHALRWQRLINTGEAWVCNAATGEIPKALIQKGYCMHAKVTIETDDINAPGRDDLFAGSPGTPSFVAAIMGQAWLVWLQGQE